MGKKLNSRCLFCNGDLEITCLHCKGCGTRIESDLPIPRYFRLGPDLQELVLVFLRCRGNIREVEKELGISYPTVCKRLDLVNELLNNQSSTSGAQPRESGASASQLNTKRQVILEELEKGEINASEAAQRLRALAETKAADPS